MIDKYTGAMVTTSNPFCATDLTSAGAGLATAKTRISGTKPLSSIARPPCSGGSRHPFEQPVSGGRCHTRAGFDAREPAAQVFMFLQYRRAFRRLPEHRQMRRE
jgi:hypothetical protein